MTSLLLDAFSCTGLGADGYKAAGFDVVCLDNDERALKHAQAAGYHVVCGDALRLLNDAGFMHQFDVITPATAPGSSAVIATIEEP